MGGNTSKPRKHFTKTGNNSSIQFTKPTVFSSIRKKPKQRPNVEHERRKHIQQITKDLDDAAQLPSQLQNLSLKSNGQNKDQISQTVGKPRSSKVTRSDVNGNLTSLQKGRKKKSKAPKPPSISTKPNVSHIPQHPANQTKPEHTSQISQPQTKSSHLSKATLVPISPPKSVQVPQKTSKHSTNLQKFQIPPELITRLERTPQFTSIPFGIVGIQQINTINSAANSPLPFLPPFDFQPQKPWSLIQQALQNVSSLCQKGHKALDILYTTISSYNSNAQNESNFGMLNRPDLEPLLQSTLPLIAEQALQLVHLLEQPIPYLASGESKTIFLNRKLCCSLLANAFFCTYLPHSLNDMPDINFFRLFNDTNSDRCEVKKEKLKCILNYFYQMHQTATNLQFQQQIISFERRCMQKKTNWGVDNHQLCKISIEPKKKIEQADNMLQIDFANRMVGGGVLNDGSVMEEIRFSTCPELIVSRLFTQALYHDEVLVVTGTETFSEYAGYSTSFAYTRPTGTQWGKQPVDSFGRTYTQLVTMDATYFKRNDFAKQFKKRYVDRDLHKCKVAFQHGKAAISPIATGNWGCGAFNGNPELKFMIQWMAASHQDRPLMQYHINGNTTQGQSILDISTFLSQRNICVGQIYQVVLDYTTDVIEQKLHNQTTLFAYVKYRFGG